MDKKAQLVLKAIVMTVLTFFVIIPTILFLAKLIGPTPAEDSFDKLTQKIIEVNTEMEPGQKQISVLIQDIDTYVYFIDDVARGKTIPGYGKRSTSALQSPLFFIAPTLYLLSQNSPDLIGSAMSNELIKKGYKKIYVRLDPTPKCQKQNCLCLCQRYQKKGNMVTCTKLTCNTLKKDSKEVTFSPGTRTSIYRSEKDPRRQVVTIIKCKAGQEYCKKSKDGDISVIFGNIEKQYKLANVK